ncbi:hypothetical protein TRFO_16663 [Tritrichomonas foetus]|uniref:Uncharacterized protein n=1 Tax=Tritrichomonas foetus TaxID=1144522 RepID=A0A1J4KPQ8_9EUKA|nr:hypothetical protein TRFO_16663 [Tritrichomonas foetus]|eukprot:OHT13227.1 hypothetical protein TRFO_16663 [Tritrichomonas foetus]
MRADELGILFLAVADVEQNLSCLKETVDFIKLIEASRHQFVGYGHFKEIFNPGAKYIISRASELFDMFCESYPQAVTFMNSILDSHQVSSDSPIGVVVKQSLLMIETYSLFSISPLISSYKEWIEKEEINPLPLLLSPDQIFSPINPDLILSPLPSYNVPPPTPETIEQIPNNTHQSLLYHALLHAKERKTTLATEEMTRCCLKMTESNDSSCLSRSSIGLAQIFDLLGMKEESILALNESVGKAKGLSDSSVISAAVALKAKIDASTSAWRYAAEMEDPHPIALIRVALENNNFSDALKVDSFIAANTFAENSQQIASVLPLNERLLPTRVLHCVQEGQWEEAAKLIKSMNISLIEVRATALAFAVAYFSVHDMKETSEIYREDLNDVLEIDLGHFVELKPTIQKIADVYSTKINCESDYPPLDQPKLFRIKWMAHQNNNNDVNLKLLQLCIQCGDVKLFREVKQKLINNGIDIQDDIPQVVSDTYDVEKKKNSF